MQALQGLVFDKDGTLFDFHASWGEWSAGFIDDLALNDARTAAALSEALGFRLAERRFEPTSPMIAGTMEVLLEAVLRIVPDWEPAALRSHILASTAAAKQVPPVPLVRLLDRLRRAGLTLGVATNDAEEPARAHLCEAGVLSHFDFVAGYDSGHGAKPGPGMLLAFCDSTGLTPSDCAMIGDSRHDLLSGRAAGMQTIAVLTGLAAEGELADLADVVVEDIGRIPDLLALPDSG